VLDRVGEVQPALVDADLREDLPQQQARGADEGPPFLVLDVAGLALRPA
jgi:hypothetical protein